MDSRYGDFGYRTGSANGYVTGTGAYQPGQRAEFQRRITPQYQSQQQQEVNNQQTDTDEETKRKRRTLIIIFSIIGGIVLLIIIGVLVYFFFIRKTSTTTNNGTSTGVLNDPCSSTVTCQAVLFSCQNGLCKSITGGPCPGGDADCFQGQFPSTCVNEQCKRNTGQACDQNFQCVTGSCQGTFCAPCTTDAECTVNSTCNIATGICTAN